MFAEWNDYINDNETLGLLKRYHEMRNSNRIRFFDLCEFENIIDYYLNEYDYKEALAAAKIALDQHPGSISVKLHYIQILIETGKPAKALGIIRQIEKIEQSNYQIFLFKGIALNITGKYNKAVSNFNQAISLSSENQDEVAYSIAQSFLHINLHYPANKYLLLSYRFNRSNLLTLYDLALNYERLEMPEKSLGYYNEYLDLDPFAEHVWNNLGLLYSKIGELQNAVEALDFAIAINPDYLSAHLNKAEILVTQKKIIAAIEIYQGILKRNPDNTRTLCCLGDCYEETGDFSKALETYNLAITFCSDHSEAWFGKSMVLLKLRKYNQSLTAIRKALQIEPENADYWFVLGELYSRLRKYAQAVNAYQKAVRINPADHEAWLACAQIYFRKKNICEAIDTLCQSYGYINENPTLHYRLAAYHAYQDDVYNAGMHFEQGLKLNYQEYREMFKLFPKTKDYGIFYTLIEKHQQMASQNIKN